MPVVIAIAAVAALAQAYQSEQAQGASRERLNELKRQFDQLKGPDFDVSIMDPPAYIKQQPPPPNFDMSRLTPEAFKTVGKYAPDIAPVIAEKNPHLVEQTAAGQEGRGAELTALRKMMRAGSDQGDPEFAEQMAKATRAADSSAQSRRASILQDEERRGRLGSGAALAASLEGASSDMERAAETGSNAAAQAYRNKLDAIRSAGSLGSQIHGEEEQTQARNAGIINDFNARTSRNAQAVAGQNTEIRNDAQRRNLAEDQRVADANVEARNRSDVQNRDRLDKIQQYLGDYRNSQYRYGNDLAEREADWQRGERNNANALKQTSYQDLFNKTAASNNVGLMQGQQDLQAAQDRNNRIQGGANTAIAGFQYSDSNDRADARERYRQTGEWGDERDNQ